MRAVPRLAGCQILDLSSLLSLYHILGLKITKQICMEHAITILKISFVVANEKVHSTYVPFQPFLTPPLHYFSTATDIKIVRAICFGIKWFDKYTFIHFWYGWINLSTVWRPVTNTQLLCQVACQVKVLKWSKRPNFCNFCSFKLRPYFVSLSFLLGAAGVTYMYHHYLWVALGCCCTHPYTICTNLKAIFAGHTQRKPEMQLLIVACK